MEPVTTSIVTALVAGAVAGLKPTVSQAVKDSYEGLKALIIRKYSHVSIDQLEAEPTSKARRAVVEEDLQKTEAEIPRCSSRSRLSSMRSKASRRKSCVLLGWTSARSKGHHSRLKT